MKTQRSMEHAGAPYRRELATRGEKIAEYAAAVVLILAVLLAIW